MSIIIQRLLGIDILESPFMKQEIDVVAVELPSKKLPGSGGSNIKFLKKCWHTLKKYFFDLCAQFQSGTSCLQTIITITFRSHIYSYQWHNQLASNNNESRMTTLFQNNHDMI